MDPKMPKLPAKLLASQSDLQEGYWAYYASAQINTCLNIVRFYRFVGGVTIILLLFGKGLSIIRECKKWQSEKN